jgi:hypothetical protein
MFDDAEVIHRHTRADAIRDGVLIDVSATAREAGFLYPMALTAALFCQRNECAGLARGCKVGRPRIRLRPGRWRLQSGQAALRRPAACRWVGAPAGRLLLHLDSPAVTAMSGPLLPLLALAAALGAGCPRAARRANARSSPF